MIGGLFLQFLERDKLNIDFCDALPDNPLLASDLVQNEIEEGQIICFSVKGWIHGKSAEAKSVFSRICVTRSFKLFKYKIGRL